MRDFNYVNRFSYFSDKGVSSKDGCVDVICPEGLCDHGGLCLSVRHKPKCFCPAGFTGERCEINVDECASQPCYNGGTCVDSPQGYRCECAPGFTGLQCNEEDSEECLGRMLLIENDMPVVNADRRHDFKLVSRCTKVKTLWHIGTSQMHRSEFGKA